MFLIVLTKDKSGSYNEFVKILIHSNLKNTLQHDIKQKVVAILLSHTTD